MMEVVFSDSAAGSLKCALGRKGVTESHVIGIIGGDGLTKAEQRALIQQAREQERRAWEQAVPLEGSPGDVLCFPLYESVGDISGEDIGPQREQVLKELLGTCSEGAEAAQAMAETGRQSLKRLLEGAALGEPFRVWASGSPDEACGLCWLLEQLRPLGLESLSCTCVPLPPCREWEAGTLTAYQSWAEAGPHQWGRLAGEGRKLSPAWARMLQNRWRELQEENAPLRAVVNGRLVSVPEEFYDPFIAREIAVQGREFQEAVVVGRVLGRYRLGIGDGWVARRIEAFIQAGLLEAVTQPEKDEPGYHRILRKAAKVRGDYEQSVKCGEILEKPGVL